MKSKRLAFVSSLPCLCLGAGVEAEPPCLSPSLIEVDGLRPGMNQAAVESKGGYLTKEPIDGEDDGGPYTGHRFHFPRYDVVTVRGAIDSIRVTSPALPWAHGIRLGLDRASVDPAIGFARVLRGESESQYLVCSEIADIYAVLRYDRDILTSIEIIMDRP